ncbi:MAG: hypothetical protein ACREI5_07230 [Candidatus Methylomirabilales bacterium]|nr:MAG: hypothetical protein XU15_C0013G0105 [candidate division NC10 bacterium CSP1-5]
MTDTPESTTEITCPCCQARLTIDLSLGVVLHHEPPPKPSSVTDLKEAVKSLKTETAQREARFKELMQAEKEKGKVLDRKFQELLKKAKDDPLTTPPPRDIDLD